MNPTTAPSPDVIIYPDSDGLPMSDNTKQLRWMFTLYGNLTALFRGRADVFVACNLLWYPIEGRPDIRIGPDVFVAFGRPKGDRGSYKQWEEGGIPPTVVFEVLWPGNTASEMDKKLIFYEEQQVEEYYIYDPDENYLMAYIRNGDVLRRERKVNGFVSPRLGIRFDLSGTSMTIYWPDGRPFLTFDELEAVRDATKRQFARMAELSRKARRGQATVEEIRELEQLEDQAQPPSA